MIIFKIYILCVIIASKERLQTAEESARENQQERWNELSKEYGAWPDEKKKKKSKKVQRSSGTLL